MAIDINRDAILRTIQELRLYFVRTGDVDGVLTFVSGLIQDDEINHDYYAVEALASTGHAIARAGIHAEVPLTEERIAAVNELLNLADLIVERRSMLGVVYDLRNLPIGGIMRDGNIISKCPVCGKGAVIFTNGGGDLPVASSFSAVHVLQVISLLEMRILASCVYGEV